MGRFARPWYQAYALRVFRDETSLAANPALWASIARALGDSEFLLLLTSPMSSSACERAPRNVPIGDDEASINVVRTIEPHHRHSPALTS